MRNLSIKQDKVTSEINFSSGLFFFGNIVVQIGIASLFYFFFEKRLSQIWKNALNGKNIWKWQKTFGTRSETDRSTS